MVERDERWLTGQTPEEEAGDTYEAMKLREIEIDEVVKQRVNEAKAGTKQSNGKPVAGWM
jgi:hypothetical protein